MSNCSYLRYPKFWWHSFIDHRIWCENQQKLALSIIKTEWYFALFVIYSLRISWSDLLWSYQIIICRFTIVQWPNRYVYESGRYISMRQYKKDITPVLTHWSYAFLALTPRYKFCRYCMSTICRWVIWDSKFAMWWICCNSWNQVRV